MAFSNAALTAGAVLLDDLQSRLYRMRDLARLLLLAPLDLVLYRPIIVWARFKGSWGFLRGDKAWHKFERNVRAGLIRRALPLHPVVDERRERRLPHAERARARSAS